MGRAIIGMDPHKRSAAPRRTANDAGGLSDRSTLIDRVGCHRAIHERRRPRPIGSWFPKVDPNDQRQNVRFFLYTPEAKTAKNRVHFDLRAPGPADDEIARLVSLGASVLRRFPHVVVMADPEDNEFCVE